MRERVARFEVVIVPPLVHYIHYIVSSNPPVMERSPRLLKSPSRFPGGPYEGRSFPTYRIFL
jgi:hypothetical protein